MWQIAGQEIRILQVMESELHIASLNEWIKVVDSAGIRPQEQVRFGRS